MIAEKQVVKLANEFLKGTDLFLIEVLVKPTNKISVFIDGLKGVTIEGCQQLSRYIEEHLDRESEDFDLTVSSPGADRPLKHPAQYTKNLGKELEIVTLAGDKLIGKVNTADEHGISISYIEKRPKKLSEEKIISLLYHDIKSAKEVITFKK